MDKLYVKHSNNDRYSPTELNRQYTLNLMETIMPLYKEMLKELSPIEAEYMIHSVAVDLRLNTLCGLDL